MLFYINKVLLSDQVYVRRNGINSGNGVLNVGFKVFGDFIWQRYYPLQILTTGLYTLTFFILFACFLPSFCRSL